MLIQGGVCTQCGVQRLRPAAQRLPPPPALHLQRVRRSSLHPLHAPRRAPAVWTLTPLRALPLFLVQSLSARKGNIQSKKGSKKKSAQPQTVGEKLASRAKKFVAMRKTEKAKSQPGTFARKRGTSKAGGAAPAAAAVPAAGWQAVADPNTGQTYYFNSATNETSWTLPA